jgi:type IV pilus assembly protein PilM
MNLFKKERINLIFQQKSIRYVVKSGNNSFDYGEIALESGIIDDGVIMKPEELTTILKNLVQEKKWKRRSIAICVPDTFVTIREEKVPKQLSDEEIKKYILLELKGNIRLPFQDPIIDFEPLEEDGENKRILLFAYPKEKLQPYIDLLEQIDLKITIADVSFLSIYRVAHQLGISNKEQHLLMIQWGKTSLVLTVFHKGIPIFNRHIHLIPSMQQEDNAISKEQLIEVIDDQLLTIDRFMDFYRYSVMNDQAQITEVLLSGDDPNQELIYEVLLNRLNLPVHLLKLEQAIPYQYADAYGLTLRN